MLYRCGGDTKYKKLYEQEVSSYNNLQSQYNSLQSSYNNLKANGYFPSSKFPTGSNYNSSNHLVTNGQTLTVNSTPFAIGIWSGYTDWTNVVWGSGAVYVTYIKNGASVTKDVATLLSETDFGSAYPMGKVQWLFNPNQYKIVSIKMNVGVNTSNADMTVELYGS